MSTDQILRNSLAERLFCVALFYRIAKRLFDLVFSVLGLVLCAPLMPLLALWVRIDSRGAVFYFQERLGLNARLFRVIKYRTMVFDAETTDGPQWARANDPRRTRCGRILRKLYLDEIPQLINILRGEMSFVGPRPERPHFYPICEVTAPGFARRLQVKPGLTGLAQVFQPHHRSSRQLRRKYRYDMLYLQRCSLGLDIWILARTLALVLSEAGELLRLRRMMSLLLLVALLGSMACAGREIESIELPFENREHGLFPGNDLAGEQVYRVGIGDTLSLFTRRHPEFSARLRVESTGHITLPLVLSPIHVTGLTLSEVENKIVNAIRSYVKEDPFVQVKLWASDSRFFYVMGMVDRPGKYPMLDETVFVREAVERAGWPLKNAASHRSRLVSSSPDQHRSLEVNFEDISLRGDLTSNYAMKPGDIIYVPESYASAFVFKANLWLQPIAVILGFDTAVANLYTRPAIRHVSRKRHDENTVFPTDGGSLSIAGVGSN